MLSTQSSEHQEHPRATKSHLRFQLSAVATLATTLTVLTATTQPASADPCSVAGGNKFGCAITGNGKSGGGTPGSGNSGSGDEFPEYSADPGGGGGGTPTDPDPLPTPQEIAEALRASAEVPVPRVHTAPSGKTFVRLRTNLWVDNYIPVQAGPITSGNRTIQATARPYAVEWNVGETTLRCSGPGSPNSAACSHTYRRSSSKIPGGAYQITATILWQVTWSCEGAGCGPNTGGRLDDLSQTSAPQPLVVSEIQTNSRP